MAKTAIILSRCECQARLGAELNEERHVLHGWASDRRGAELVAPCHSIEAEDEHFQLAWLCPLCNRNTLRSFYAGALVYREAANSDATTAPEPSSTAP